MGKINWGRVIGGGLVAGLVGNALQALNGFLMKAQSEQMMKSIHKEMVEPKALVAHLVWSFVLGIAAIWLYAAIRPRYGPGPTAALRAGFAVWISRCICLAKAILVSSPAYWKFRCGERNRLFGDWSLTDSSPDDPWGAHVSLGLTHAISPTTTFSAISSG